MNGPRDFTGEIMARIAATLGVDYETLAKNYQETVRWSAAAESMRFKQTWDEAMRRATPRVRALVRSRDRRRRKRGMRLLQRYWP